MNVFYKVIDAIKKFCGNVNNAVRNWLLDCLDAVDGETYRRAIDEGKQWCKRTEHTERRIRAVTVAIPSTMAPWYEDEMFSRKLWDEIRDYGVATFETEDQKYATVCVLTTDGWLR